MTDSKFALITGASGGIGLAFCKKLAQIGYNLIITARSIDKLEAVKNSLLKDYSNIIIDCFACDLTDSDQRLKLFEFIESSGITIDLLVNVAGVDTQKSFQKYTHEKLVFQTRVLFEATVDVTHYCLANNKNSLKVLTISSMCSIMPMPYFAIYCSLKNALIQFFRSIAYEYKGNKNIVFTTILPGSVPTRTDIINDIKKQGFTGKLSAKSPDFIVSKSLKALDKRKKIYVPGAYNKFIYLLNKLTPKFLKIKLIARKFSQKEKDAF